jgi:hypothetical protein
VGIYRSYISPPLRERIKVRVKTFFSSPPHPIPLPSGGEGTDAKILLNILKMILLLS